MVAIDMPTGFDSATVTNNIAAVHLDLRSSAVIANYTNEQTIPDGSTKFTAYSWFKNSPAALSESILMGEFLGTASKGVPGFSLENTGKSSPGHYSAVFNADGVFVGFTYADPNVASGIQVLDLFDYLEFIKSEVEKGSSGDPLFKSGAKAASKSLPDTNQE